MRLSVIVPLLITAVTVSCAERWHDWRSLSRKTYSSRPAGRRPSTSNSDLPERRLNGGIPEYPASKPSRDRETMSERRRHVDPVVSNPGLSRHGGDPSRYPSKELDARGRHDRREQHEVPNRQVGNPKQGRELDPVPSDYWSHTRRHGHHDDRRHHSNQRHHGDRRHQSGEQHGVPDRRLEDLHQGRELDPVTSNPWSHTMRHGHHSDRYDHSDQRHHSDRRHRSDGRHHPHAHGESSSTDGDQRGEREYEYAPYSVICESPEGFELRSYEEAVWATTVVNDSTDSFFHILYRYIAGNNDQGVKIPMSKPVRKRMIRRTDPENRTRDVFYSASFYLPRRFWDNPPLPLDETVFLERVSSLAFTSNFSGWANEWSMTQQYNRLSRVLQQEGHPIVEREFDVQCYNPPWDVIDRHNEILIEADTDMGTASCDSGVRRNDSERYQTGSRHEHHRHGHRGDGRGQGEAQTVEDRGRWEHRSSGRGPSWDNRFRGPPFPTHHPQRRPEWARGHHHRHGHSESRSSSSSSSSSSEEDRCDREYESAPYTVTCVSSNGYELRRYEEAVWAFTVVNGSTSRYFHKLYRYISGDNDQSVKIPMSKPVRKKMLRQDVESSTINVFHSASFYLPRRFWDNPPQPLEDNVSVERVPPMWVFTSNFSGWANDWSINRHYNGLKRMLTRDGHPIVEEEFYVQGYNPPWDVVNRHNEILIESTVQEPTCDPQPEVTEKSPDEITQCRDHECPSFNETGRINDNVVIRHVAAGVYATKKSTTCNMTNVMSETYMPLREYFMGANEHNASIPSTVPVLQLAMRPDRSERLCNFTYQASFYIPQEFQTAPPAPVDESIVISEADPSQYFVMTFHETPTPRVAFQKYKELKALVTETGRCYQPGEFRLAFYDAPFRPLPHRYEMWIPVGESCNDVIQEDFDESVIPFDEGGNVILPMMNDDPVPPPKWGRRGKKKMDDRDVPF